jgi:hypothetical protein
MKIPASFYGKREFLSIVQLTQRIFSPKISGKIAYKIISSIDMVNY